MESHTPGASEQHFALDPDAQDRQQGALQAAAGEPATNASAPRLSEGIGLNQQLIGQHQQAMAMPTSDSRPLRQDSKASASGSAVSAPHPDAVRAAIDRITDWLAHVESPDPSLRLAPTPKPEPVDTSASATNLSQAHVHEASAMSATGTAARADSSSTTALFRNNQQQRVQSGDEERFLIEQLGRETLERLRNRQFGSSSAVGGPSLLAQPLQDLLNASQTTGNTPSLPTPSAIVPLGVGAGAQRGSFFSNQSQVYAQLLSGPASPQGPDAAAVGGSSGAANSGANKASAPFAKNAAGEQRERHSSRESGAAAAGTPHIVAPRRPANLPTDRRQSTSPHQRAFVSDTASATAVELQRPVAAAASPGAGNPALEMGLSAVQPQTSSPYQSPSNAENTQTLHLPERPRQIDPRAARGLLFESPAQHQPTFGSACLARFATSGGLSTGTADSSLALQMLHQVHPQGEPVPLFPASLYDSPPHQQQLQHQAANRLSSQSPLRQPPLPPPGLVAFGPLAGVSQPLAGPDANALLLHYPQRESDPRQSIESVSVQGARSRCAALFASSNKTSAAHKKKSHSSHHKSSRTVIGLPCTRKSYAVGEELASCENLYRQPVAQNAAAVNHAIANGNNAADGLVLQNPYARTTLSMPLQQQQQPVALPRQLTAKEAKKLKGKKGATSEVCFPATYQHPLLSSLPAGAGLGPHPLLLRQPPQNPASSIASAPGSAVRLNFHQSSGSIMTLQQQQLQQQLLQQQRLQLQLPNRAQPLQEHANSDMGALPVAVPLAAAAHQRTLLSASKTFAALSTLSEHQPLRSNAFLNEAPISCSALSRTSAPIAPYPLNESAANASDSAMRGGAGASNRHDTRLSLSSFLARVPPAEQPARRGRLRMDVASDTGTAGTNSSVVLGTTGPLNHQMSYTALTANAHTRLNMRQYLISREAARSSVLRRLASKQHSSASSTVVSKGSGSKGSKQPPAAGTLMTVIHKRLNILYLLHYKRDHIVRLSHHRIGYAFGFGTRDRTAVSRVRDQQRLRVGRAAARDERVDASRRGAQLLPLELLHRQFGGRRAREQSPVGRRRRRTAGGRSRQRSRTRRVPALADESRDRART